MTQEPVPRPFWLLRRNDQLAVAVFIVLGLICATAWWTLAGGWQGRSVEVDQAQQKTNSFKVDINKAAWPELAQLPRIGETVARKIVESRETDGPFKSVDDLQRVKGIGPKTVERLRPFVLPIQQ